MSVLLNQAPSPRHAGQTAPRRPRGVESQIRLPPRATSMGLTAARPAA
jgi:hypothetical protein